MFKWLRKFKSKTRLRGGALYLLIFGIVSSNIVKKMFGTDQSIHSLSSAISDAIGSFWVLSIFIYAIICWFVQLERTWKTILLTFFSIAILVGGFYYGRYEYWAETTRVLNKISALKPQETFQKLTNLKDTINSLTQSINSNPEDKQQAKQFIGIIDSLIELQNRYSDLYLKFNGKFVDIFSSVNDIAEKVKIQNVLNSSRSQRINMCSLPGTLKLFKKWHTSLVNNLLARKDYYQAYIYDSPRHNLDSLQQIWVRNEAEYMTAESLLVVYQPVNNPNTKEQ